MTRDNCVLLGTISKTHGVRGELIIRIASPAFEANENWESLFLQIDGILVPFFIASLQTPKAEEWIICFDDYEDKDSAQRLVGLPVWIEKEYLAKAREAIYLDELTGYTLINLSTGKQGLINDFMDIPGNPVFEVMVTGEKVLVPAQDNLIEEIDQEHQKLLMRLPEGIM